MKQSVFRVKKNPVLLQEKEENAAKETNYCAHVNTEANRVDNNKKDVVFTIK